jgi:hypothetical protein
MKYVRPILVNEDAVFVIVIESIASDVVAFVTDQNFFITTGGEPLCKDASGETCTDNEVIEHKLAPEKMKNLNNATFV